VRQTRRTVRVPWREPLAAAHGAQEGARELTLLTLEDVDGTVGHGESAELPGYDGSSGDLAELAALDLAEWDLRARRQRVPLWRALGAEGAAVVPVNATIGADAPAVAASAAAAAVARGFETVKVKVGVGDDLERLVAVRAAVGPRVAIRLDANGAWDVDGAVDALGVLSRIGIELCEEPTHGVAALEEVARRVPGIPISADESAEDALASGRRICAAVCLKVARGGITALLLDTGLARSLGYEVYLASTLDGPLGIAAALHAAAVIRPDRACGLATLDRFEAPVAIPVSEGAMSPPGGFGLGDGLLAFYED